mmetsp:Transcript_22431/g.52802  ORF Transcript_22431/g.52802 Transcript_22431/m.52802 type:complete len:204 (-) Transcript_22431:318-929(-)
MLKWRSVLWLRSIQGSIHFISPIEKRKRTRLNIQLRHSILHFEHPSVPRSKPFGCEDWASKGPFQATCLSGSLQDASCSPVFLEKFLQPRLIRKFYKVPRCQKQKLGQQVDATLAPGETSTCVLLYRDVVDMVHDRKHEHEVADRPSSLHKVANMHIVPNLGCKEAVRQLQALDPAKVRLHSLGLEYLPHCPLHANSAIANAH